MGLRGCCVLAVWIASVAFTRVTFAGDGNKSIFSDDGPGQRAPGPTGSTAKPRETPPPPAEVPSEAAAPRAPLPVPTGAALHAAENAVTDLYRDDFAAAKTPPQRAALAQKLLAVAAETANEPANRYVLLTRAMDLSLAAGDAQHGCEALELLAGQYRMDVGQRLAILTSFSKVAVAPRDFGMVVLGSVHCMADLVRDDHYDLAHRAADLAIATARRSKVPMLITESQGFAKDLAETEAAYPAAKRAMAVLAVNPADPAANAVAGRFLCFLKGEWLRGLPLLVAGSEPALRELANADLRCPPDPTARVGVADRWWDVAEYEKGLARETIQGHARVYYRAALPGLSGLAKAKAAKRIGADAPGSAGNDKVVTVAVKGQQGWQKAVAVKKGETVKIAATGTWTTWRDGHYTCDANGRPDGKWAFDKSYLEGALIGRIGDRVALIGKSATFRAAEDGELELRCNQDDAHLHDDDGELQVTITKS